MSDRFSHLDEEGSASMVDVSSKEITRRTATARCSVDLGEEVYRALRDGETPKGDVLAVARVAGIQAAKRTAETIPLCHPLPLDRVEIRFEPEEQTSSLGIEARVVVTARTGAEMEALTACAVAALTVYDMCKAMSKSMRINQLRLVAKSGGRSGDYREQDC